MYLGFYPLHEADESWAAAVSELLINVQHRRVLGVVVGEDGRHAQLHRLRERLQLDSPGDATAPVVGVTARISRPHASTDGRKAKVRQGGGIIASDRDPQAVVRPVGRTEPLHEILEGLGNDRKGARYVLLRH